MSGMPLSAVKFTMKEAEAGLELVKYKADYQLPPNANCERIWGLVGGVTSFAATQSARERRASIRDPGGNAAQGLLAVRFHRTKLLFILVFILLA
jgi:hypothetical protein